MAPCHLLAEEGHCSGRPDCSWLSSVGLCRDTGAAADERVCSLSGDSEDCVAHGCDWIDEERRCVVRGAPVPCNSLNHKATCKRYAAVLGVKRGCTVPQRRFVKLAPSSAVYVH